MNGRLHGQMDRQMDSCMGVWMNHGWAYGWIRVSSEVQKVFDSADNLEFHFRGDQRCIYTSLIPAFDTTPSPQPF